MSVSPRSWSAPGAHVATRLGPGCHFFQNYLFCTAECKNNKNYFYIQPRNSRRCRRRWTLSESHVNEEEKKEEEKKNPEGEDRGGGTLHKGITDEPGWTADLVPKGSTSGLPRPR